MTAILERHLKQLSNDYFVSYDDIANSVTIHQVALPDGFNRSFIDILIEIPYDYPQSPPGVAGSGVFVDQELRYHGRIIRDFHINGGPSSHSGLAWFCYETIEWDPHYDNLQTLLAKIRNDILQAAKNAEPQSIFSTTPPPRHLRTQEPTGIGKFIGRVADLLGI